MSKHVIVTLRVTVEGLGDEPFEFRVSSNARRRVDCVEQVVAIDDKLRSLVTDATNRLYSQRCMTRLPQLKPRPDLTNEQLMQDA